MRRSKRHYDEWADRLAARDRDLGDEDAVSAFVGLLQVESAEEPVDPQLPTTLAAEALHAAQDAPTRTARSRVVRPLTMRWRRRAMISTFLTTLFGKIAIGSVAVAVAATGAAATGNLPDAAQQRVSDAFGGIGIEIPAPERDAEGAGDEALGDGQGSVETTAPVLPEEASDKAKAVTGTVFEGDPTTGRTFGEAVSGTASDGAGNGIPQLPVVPERPQVPLIPEIPAAPEVPALPEQPEAPAAPEVPGMPEGLELPEQVPPTPEIPELPGDADEGLSRRP